MVAATQAGRRVICDQVKRSTVQPAAVSLGVTGPVPFELLDDRGRGPPSRRTRARCAARRWRSRPRSPRTTAWNVAGGQVVAGGGARPSGARARCRAGGLRCPTRSSTARSAPSPWRPRRLCRRTACSTAARETVPANRSCRSAGATAAGATCPRSTRSLSGFVAGIPARRTGRRSVSTVGVWAQTQGSATLRDRSAKTRSTGASSKPGMPQRCAAERCDAMPSPPVESTAARIRCSGVVGAPGSAATRGATARRRPARSAEYHASRPSPTAAAWSRVTSPCWRDAMSVERPVVDHDLRSCLSAPDPERRAAGHPATSRGVPCGERLRDPARTAGAATAAAYRSACVECHCQAVAMISSRPCVACQPRVAVTSALSE